MHDWRKLFPNSRFARLEKALSKLTALHESHANLIEKQHISIDTINNLLSELTVGLKTLDAKVEQQLRRNVTPVGPSSSPTPPFVNNQIPTQSSDFTPSAKTMRIDFPRFSGDHPSAWVARIQRYFDYYREPESQHLIVASFHLDGDAL